MMKSNMNSDDLEVEERDGLSSAPPVPVSCDILASEDDCRVLQREGAGESNIIPPSGSLMRTRSATARSRRVSAPAVMEVDTAKAINGVLKPQSSNTAISLSSQSNSSPPPEILKSQLLAVLRSRLPEGTKTGDAPLRMKKFVVWNGEFARSTESLDHSDSFLRISCFLHLINKISAWVRRATIPTSRSRYRRRSISPESSGPVVSITARSAASLSPPHADDYVSDPTSESIIIDSSDPSLPFPEETLQYTSSPLQEEDGDGLFDSSIDSSSTITALGLMMHDETARTARRFSRAFAEADSEEDGEDGDLQSDLLREGRAGPFMSSTGTSNGENMNAQVDTLGSNSLHLHSPSPMFAASEASQYSSSSQRYPMEHHRYSSLDPGDNQQIDMHNSRNRPMSPLRARLESKVPTSTPPSYSADLAGDDYTSPPLYYEYHINKENRSMEQEDEVEATIVPFWFDQERVTFEDAEHDDTDSSEADHEAMGHYVHEIFQDEIPFQVPPQSISPNNGKEELASSTLPEVNSATLGHWNHTLDTNGVSV